MFGKYEYSEDQIEPSPAEPGVKADLASQPVETVPVNDLERTDNLDVATETELFYLVENKWTARLRKFARGVLLTLVVLVPIFVLPFTAPGDVLSLPKQSLIYALIMVTFILWVAMIVQQGGLSFKRSGLEWGILGVVVAMLVASIFSINLGRSFLSANGFLVVASLTLMAMLFANLFEKRDIGRIINYFLLGSMLALLIVVLNLFSVSAFKWLQWLLYEGTVVSPQFNTIGSVNSAGVLAVMILVLAISRIFGFMSFRRSSLTTNDTDFARTNWFWSGIRLLTVVVAVLLLLIINWWIFYLAVAMATTLVVLVPTIIDKKYGIKSKLTAFQLVGPAMIVVLAIACIVSTKYFPFSFPGRQNLTPEVTLSQSVSNDIIEGVLKKKTVNGYGPDNFYVAYDMYRPVVINNSIFWNARFNSSASELNDILVESGVLGMVAILVLLFYVFKTSFWHKPSTDTVQGMFGLWIIVPGFLAGAVLLALYPFNIVHLFTFWLLVSLVAIAVNNPEKNLKISTNNTSLPSVISSFGFVIILVLTLVGGYFVFEKYRAEYYFAQAARLDLGSKENLEKATAALVKSVNSGRGEIKYMISLSQVLLARIELEKRNTTDKPEDVRARLEGLVRSVAEVASGMTERFKHDATSWFNSGLVYENISDLVTGAPDAALVAYNEYIKRVPNDPSGNFKVGFINLARSERNNVALATAKSRKQVIRNEKEVVDLIVRGYLAAEDNFKKSVELKKDYASALYNLGIVYERQNKIKDAIRQLELTAASDIRNPSLAFELGLLYYRDSQKDKALTEMMRATSLFSDYSNARWYLALMLEERGLIDQAIGQLKEIVKLDVNKDNPVVLEKIASLEAGKREIPPAKVTSKKPLDSVPKTIQ